MASYPSRYINAVMDRVANGTTLFILDQPDLWAQHVMDNLYRHPSVEYLRSVHWGADGRFIAGESPMFAGLPQSQAMNWEYQVFYRGDIWGIDMNRLGSEVLVALACENRRDIVTALSRTPFGEGQVFLCTLRIVPELASGTPQSAVAKKLFLNLLEIPGKTWLK